VLKGLEKPRVDLVQTMGETCACGAYGDKEQASDKVSTFEFASPPRPGSTPRYQGHPVNT
jgi:hypothetical protein